MYDAENNFDPTFTLNAQNPSLAIEMPSRGHAAIADMGEPVGGRVKRGLDIVLVLLVLPAVLLICAVVAVLVRLSSPGPVFFRHERIGFGGVPFKCTKFRTMHLDADEQLARHLRENPEARKQWEVYRKLRNDPRIIPVVGRLLRKSSLDELPQLFDVLRGRMSLVGPRPVTREELVRYGSASVDYMATRPGVTGLWQVSGRNSLDFDQRVEIDKRYVANWSATGDVGIMLRTVKVLATGDGAC